MMGGKKHEIPDEVRDWISREVRRELEGMAGKDIIKVNVAARFVVGAFLEVMHWWLDEGTQLSPSEVDQLFQSLAFEGLNTVLTAEQPS